jgi:hypothetical protein
MWRGLEVVGCFDEEDGSFDPEHFYAVEEQLGKDGARYRNFGELPDWLQEDLWSKHDSDIAQAAGECGDD